MNFFKQSVFVSHFNRFISVFMMLCLYPYAQAHEFSIEEVRVSGERTTLIGGANSASMGVISQEEIASRPMASSGKFLEHVPGMVATQHSGNGKANQYNLRGFNLDHGTDFATYVDYMPVNFPSHGHGQGYADLNFVIPELVQSINYKKGSYYGSLGDFSGIGAAQIYSTSELSDNVVSLGLGEFGFSRLLNLGQFETHASKFIYGVEAQTYTGPWDDVDEDVEKINVWAKQQWVTDSGQIFNVSLMVYDNSWNSADQIPLRAVNQNIISEFGSIDTDLGGESHRYSVSARWQWKPAENSKIDANMYVIDYQLNLWSNFTYFTKPEGDEFEQFDKRKVYGWDIRYGSLSTFFDKEMTNVFGSQLRYDDIGEIALYDSQDRVRTGVTRSDAVVQYSLGLFWENTIAWTENFRTILSLRQDNYHFDVDPQDARVSETIDVNGGTTSDDITTASLNLAYTISPELETYFSVGQGFHSNDARGVTIQQDPNTGESLEAADPLVDTMGYEWGLRLFTSDKLNASLALWQLDIDSELIFVGDEGGTEDTGVASTRKGIELTAYYYVNEALTLDAQWAKTDSELSEAVDGTREIPGAIDDVLSAGVQMHWNSQFTTSLRARYVGEYPLATLISGEKISAEKSTLLNLRCQYQFTDAIKLRLDLMNLLDSQDYDVEYFYASQLQAEASEVEDHHFHVLEPRSARLFFEYRY